MINILIRVISYGEWMMHSQSLLLLIITLSQKIQDGEIWRMLQKLATK